jgi:hypothetical protein
MQFGAQGDKVDPDRGRKHSKELLQFGIVTVFRLQRLNIFRI